MSNTYPKVTVLMTVYNGAGFLKVSIESILKQTFTDFELLIVNDGSTENISAIISSYHDPRIRFIDRMENKGRVFSLNEGLVLAEGQYIAVQDADDISLPDRLEKEVALLDNHLGIGLTGTFFSIINEEGIIVSNEKMPATDEKIRKKLPVQNVFAHGSLMFRKELLAKSGPYREEFSTDQCEDYEFLLRILEHTELANIPEYLYQWRLHKSSFTANRRYFQNLKSDLARQMYQERKVGKKDAIQSGTYIPDSHSKEIPSPTEVKSKKVKDFIINGYHFQIMALLYNNGKLAALTPWRKAFSYNPWDLKTWFFLVLILLRFITPKHLFYNIIYGIYKIRSFLV